MVPSAFAQSNTTGSIFGRVEAGAGTSVSIENTATGQKKTIPVGADGRFLFTALPPGTYKAKLLSGDTVKDTIDLEVLIGQGAEAAFATRLQSVEVTARRVTIDVSSSTNGVNFTAKELAELPIARNIGSIIQLAPNTTRADPRYPAGAVFGGGAASENSYYINGFPVTNPLTQLGSSELPFGAIGTTSVQTGGFGVEFGRSVGGVVNIVTKSGTNEWEGGASISFSPNALRSKGRDIYYPVTGATDTNGDPYISDGKLYRLRGKNTVDASSLGAYVGGPLIKDSLFMFLAAETLRENSGTVVGVRDWYSGETADPTGWRSRHAKTDRYLAKFDWNLTPDHSLELTLIGDRPSSDDKLSGFDYASLSHDSNVAVSSHFTNFAPNTAVGGASQIFKYTGHWTQDLTVTALYGQSKTPHINTYDGYDINKPLFQVSVDPGGAAPGQTYNLFAQPLSGTVSPPGAEDTVKTFRLDAEYQWGDHLFRVGLDNNKLKSKNAGEFTAGGGTWIYRGAPTRLTSFFLPGQTTTLADGGGLGPQGFYVRKGIFTDVTDAASNQGAQYIEDQWHVSRDVRLTLGLRNETYENVNGDGVAFLKMPNQINPRFGAAWDVNGDSSLKAFGSLGRYAIQIPTHLAVRGASRSSLTRQYFTYTGVDANGQPTGLNPISDVTSADGELGQAKDPRTVAAIGIKPTFQDEITLGFEKALSKDWNTGAKMTYRNLRSTIDDFCDERPFDKYAADHNIDTSNWSGFSCASFNPGKANSFYIDYAGTGTDLTRVDLSAADLGFPKARRTYFAFDTFLEHPLKDGWYGKINYTYSRALGNTEGQTLSDVGQTDVAATQTWDFHEIMDYSYGRGLNDRRHQIKGYGFLEVTPEWGVGVNALTAAGAPISCLGNYPDLATNNTPDYGSSTHYCGGYLDWKHLDADGNPTVVPNTPSPRGTAGSLPWDVNFDLQLAYKPEFLKGVQATVDIFNVFNRQIATAVDAQYNSDVDIVSNTYRRVIAYTSPRTVKLTLEYNKKF